LRSAPPRRSEDTMTTEQKIIRAKVGLLELAKQLGNVNLISVPETRDISPRDRIWESANPGE